MIRRRTVLAAALLAPAVARANRPWNLTLMVGGRAGSPADQAARAFAPYLERYLPRSRVVIAALPGEAGGAALRALGSAEADGTVAGFVSTPTVIARALDGDAPDLMDRIELAGAVSSEAFALVVEATRAPPGSAGDLLAAVGAEEMPVATTGRGTPAHLALLRMAAALGRTLRIVCFPAAAAARQAVADGTATVALLPLSTTLGAAREGRLKIMAVTAGDAERPADLPGPDGLPLLAIRRGLALPSGVPESKRARLAAALRGVAADPEFPGLSPGVTTGFLPGPAWRAIAEAEHAALARLWGAAPWGTLAGRT